MNDKYEGLEKEMNIDAEGITDQMDKPLKRAEVESLLHEVGSSNLLNLSGKNMSGIDLAKFMLTEADLSEVNLSGADLSEADLSRANLSRADLSEANLSEAKFRGANLSEAKFSRADLREADLSYAYFSRTYFSGADLREADLRGANFSEADLSRANLGRANLGRANLSKANLSEADLSRTNLSRADLSDADLSRANLSRANLSGADLRRANLKEAIVSEFERKQLRDKGAIGLDAIDLDNENVQTASPTSLLRIRITEEPLTAYNLTTIISALTEISTKFWLIVDGHFSELIDYTQTHDVQYVQEAGLVITKLTHNSSLDISLGSPNLDPKNIADALFTTIDGVSQHKAEFEKTDLENPAKAQTIKLVEQKATLERKKLAHEIEKERLALLQQQLDLQKQGIDCALEIAKKAVDLLNPNADATRKGMIIQTLLPNILQLQNSKGLVLALPDPKNDV